MGTNPYPNVAGVRSFQGIYDLFQPSYTNTQIPVGRYPVGSIGRLDDGRMFMYCRNGTTGALAASKLYSHAADVSNHLILAVAAAVGVGSTVVGGITIGATAMTVNQYKGGYFIVSDGTGAGQYYKIASHAAFLSAATTVSVTLEDPLVVALDSTSKVGFIKNRGDAPLLEATTGLDLVGIPQVAVAAEVSASSTVLGQATYAWFQCWGPAVCLIDGANVVDGATLVVSANTAGAAMADTTAGGAAQIQIVGTSMAVTATTKYGPVDLRIAAG